MIHQQDSEEYCAALTASAVYNVHRKANTAFLLPDQLMLRHRTRLGAKSGTPSGEVMRYARPGERPPSSRPPGAGDGVIDRFDKFASRLHQGGRRIN